MPNVLRRLILWDYPRGVWQYDVICALILLFIFAAPARWFNDQPRVANVVQIATPAQPGESAFWLDTDVVNPIPEASRLAEVSKIVTGKTRKAHTITRIEPIYDAEQELKGYMAYSRP